MWLRDSALSEKCCFPFLLFSISDRRLRSQNCSSFLQLLPTAPARNRCNHSFPGYGRLLCLSWGHTPTSGTQNQSNCPPPCGVLPACIVSQGVPFPIPPGIPSWVQSPMPLLWWISLLRTRGHGAPTEPLRLGRPPSPTHPVLRSAPTFAAPAAGSPGFLPPSGLPTRSGTAPTGAQFADP